MSVKSGWLTELRCNDCTKYLADDDTGYQVTRKDMQTNQYYRVLLCGACFVRPRPAPSTEVLPSQIQK